MLLNDVHYLLIRNSPKLWPGNDQGNGIPLGFIKTGGGGGGGIPQSYLTKLG